MGWNAEGSAWRMAEPERVTVAYAWHTISPSTVGELCRACGEPAAHKVGDYTGPKNFHQLTAYLCCTHMRVMGMNCRLYPPY